MPTILFLGANPSDTTRLGLDREVRSITERLRSAGGGDRFQLVQEWAVRVDDLEGHLLRHRPDVVHLSGHGSASGQIVLADGNDHAVAVPRDAVSRLFKTVREGHPNLRCVVLNECFSAEQAGGIAESIDVVVGMARAVNDDSAIAFSGAFYQALAFGESVETAFALGREQVGLKALPGVDVPQLVHRDGVKADAVRFDAAPEAAKEPALFEGPGRVPALAVPHFTGRAEELAALRRLLAGDDGACVVVTGMGGVGKTAFVQQFVATEAPGSFAAGAAWLDATELPAELARVATRFGWSDARAPAPDEATRWLAGALHDQAVLLVVDNVDPARVDLAWIPVPGGRCRTVVTSRSTTLQEDLGKPARTLVLGQWDAATSRAYLRAVVPALATTPDAALDALTAFVNGLPLAVRLLARMLQRPGATAESVQAALSAQPLAALEAVARGADRGVAATFQAAFQDLDDAHRGVLLALASCARATRAPVVAAVAALDAEAAAAALADLAERSLATFTSGAERPWSLHDVLVLYIRHQDGMAAVDEAHRAFAAAHAEAHAAPADWEAMELDASEVLLALDRLIAAGDGLGAARLLDTSAPYLWQRGRYRELLDLGTRLLPLLPSGAERAAVERGLGKACRMLGDVPGAVDHIRRALALFEQLGEVDGQAKAWNSLGICEAVRGDVPAAIDDYQRSLTLRESAGDVQGQAQAIGNLGHCYALLGDMARAVEHYQRALPLFEQLGDLVDQEEVYANLGNYHRVLGQPTEALDCLRRALALGEQLGNLEGQAETLANLGDLHQSLGDLPSAVDENQRSLDLATRLGQVAAQARAHSNLGGCCQASGDLAGAAEHYRRALELQKTLGSPDDHPEVQRLTALFAGSRVPATAP
jgi:tetratricopeptide (TPR) repeat protein